MKKSNVFIALAITIILAASSIGVVFAAQATSSTATTTQGAINFTAPSGIRWNEGMQVFEVFNYTGVSIMGQDKQWVNAVGDVVEVEPEATTGYQLAARTSNYNIMKDIPYDANATVYNDFRSSGTINFGESGSPAGIIDGRGFTFKNFPVRSNDRGLYNNFNGTLRNLNLDFGIVTADHLYGAIFYENYGKIENCTVLGSKVDGVADSYFFPFGYNNRDTGEIRNCTNYFSAILTVETSQVSGFVGNNYGLIANCTNQANLQAARSTGIVSVARTGTTAKILDCTNNGNITADSTDAAIHYNIAAGIAHAVTADNYTIRGCVNNGTVEAKSTAKGVACGILAAPNDNTVSFNSGLTNSFNNTNNGTISGASSKTFPLYYGRTGATRD